MSSIVIQFPNHSIRNLYVLSHGGNHVYGKALMIFRNLEKVNTFNWTNANELISNVNTYLHFGGEILSPITIRNNPINPIPGGI